MEVVTAVPLLLPRLAVTNFRCLRRRCHLRSMDQLRTRCRLRIPGRMCSTAATSPHGFTHGRQGPGVTRLLRVVNRDLRHPTPTALGSPSAPLHQAQHILLRRGPSTDAWTTSYSDYDSRWQSTWRRVRSKADQEGRRRPQGRLPGHGPRTPCSQELVVALEALLLRQPLQLQQPPQQAPTSTPTPTSHCLAKVWLARHTRRHQTRLWPTCHHGLTCPPSRLSASRRRTGRAQHGRHRAHQYRRRYHSRHGPRSCRCSETAALWMHLSPQAATLYGFISGSAG